MFNKKIHKRIKITLIVIIFCFILIIGKVFYIQVIEYDKLNNLANNLWSRNLVIGANRGRIITSDNVTVADNLTTVSLVVVPNQIKNKDDVIKDLAKILNIFIFFVFFLDKNNKFDYYINHQFKFLGELVLVSH